MPANIVGNTGESLQVWMDMNEFSPTFRQEEERLVTDTDNCSVPDTNPNWVEQSKSCNTVVINGLVGYDGTATVVYKDTNQYSSTYNTTKQETVTDTATCPPSNPDPDWVEQSRTCNKKTYQPSGTR